MKKYLVALLFLLPILTFAANSAATSIHVTSTQPEFTIALPGNATTGYAWSVSHYDQQLLELLASSYVTNKNTTLMGAPGTFVFTFKALPAAFSKPETTSIIFVYARPWIADKNHAEQQTYTINITQ